MRVAQTRLSGIAVVLSAMATQAVAASFTQQSPGALVTGSGTGVAGPTIYLPDMRFPIENPPAFANSQVYGFGGSHGRLGGGQCDPGNYSYPWTDNFCETRSYSTPICPAGHGHQGQDIRPASCDKDKYWAVAVEDGQITNIGRYTVTMLGASGTMFRYLHLNMDKLAVHPGQKLKSGDRIGLVSNHFGSTPTTIHLHFEMKQYVQDQRGNRAFTFVPPYTSLVNSYERLLKEAKLK